MRGAGAASRGREPKARITLINYGNLGPALDANCSIATRVDYFYRTTAGGFAPWPAGTSSYPSDLAQTTNTLGVSVPYIIRMETGTVNRSIYQEDSGPGSKFQKVIRNTRDATPTFIAQKLDRDPSSTCEQLYPSYSFPREVAGADVAADIVKCRLKPVSWRDYDVPFSSAQWARLVDPLRTLGPGRRRRRPGLLFSHH